MSTNDKVDEVVLSRTVEALEAAVHHILHKRDVYPERAFSKRAIHSNLPVMICNHPDVAEYIKEGLEDLAAALDAGKLVARFDVDLTVSELPVEAPDRSQRSPPYPSMIPDDDDDDECASPSSQSISKAPQQLSKRVVEKYCFDFNEKYGGLQKLADVQASHGLVLGLSSAMQDLEPLEARFPNAKYDRSFAFQIHMPDPGSGSEGDTSCCVLDPDFFRWKLVSAEGSSSTCYHHYHPRLNKILPVFRFPDNQLLREVKIETI